MGKIPGQPWRLLDTGSLDAFRNMSIDEAVLTSFVPSRTSITLRLYQWSRPSLSIGRFQRYDEIDWEACSRLGIDVVRRPTGGNALLHKSELTYSFIVPESQLPPSFHDSCRHINRALKQAFARLGIATEAPIKRKTRPRPVCFMSTSEGELTHQGKKILACAQVRKKGVVLQHGSMVIRHEPELLLSLVNLPHDKKEKSLRRYMSGATSISECTAAEININDLKDIVVSGFSDAFEADFTASEMKTEEISRFNELLHGKYMRTAWNQEGRWNEKRSQ